VTVTSTAPAAPAGESAVSVASVRTVTDCAGADPKSTTLAPVKPVPVTVTRVPPARGPDAGLTLVTAGSATYVYSSAELPVADVPPPVVTVTLTVPDPAGEVAVICESETTVNDCAAAEPKSTALASVNPEPLIPSVVPPASGPTGGLIPLTTGALPVEARPRCTQAAVKASSVIASSIAVRRSPTTSFARSILTVRFHPVGTTTTVDVCGCLVDNVPEPVGTTTTVAGAGVLLGVAAGGGLEMTGAGALAGATVCAVTGALGRL